MIKLKQEIVRILEREKIVSTQAIERLSEKAAFLEKEYGWATALFLQKFNRGEIGDDPAFFRWYALAEAIADWKKTLREVEAVLEDAEVVSA